MKETKNNKSQSRKTTTTPKRATSQRTPSRTTSKIKAKAEPASTKLVPTPVVAAPRQPVTTEIIAARAYSLWEKDGRPHGRDMDYWLRAETELQQPMPPQSFAA